MSKNKIIIIAVILIACIGGAFGFYTVDQNNKTNQFRTEISSVYKAHRVLANDTTNLWKNIVGRNFDNIFADLNNIKKSNTDLKLKVAAMNPPTEKAKKIHDDMTAALDDFDAEITNYTTVVEKQRTFQVQESISKSGEKYTDAKSKLDESVAKFRDSNKKYLEDKAVMEEDLGIKSEQTDSN